MRIPPQKTSLIQLKPTPFDARPLTGITSPSVHFLPFSAYVVMIGRFLQRYCCLILGSICWC